MTKLDLADAVYQRHGGLSRREAGDLVDRIFERIRRGLLLGLSVKISGFGSFSVVLRQPRTGRNPRTGTPVAIPGHRLPVFRPSRRILSGLNGGPRGAEGVARGI